MENWLLDVAVKAELAGDGRRRTARTANLVPEIREEFIMYGMNE